MDRVKVLTWKRISLVVPEKQDVELWYKNINDIETQSYLGSMYWEIVFKENEEEYYEMIRKDKTNRTFIIYVDDEKKTIWNVSLFNLDFFNKKAELGISIFDKESRNKGYWTEAINLILEFAFEVLSLNKVNLKFVKFNKRAERVYEKCWFKKCWVLRQESLRWWKYYDDILMEIFREDYLKINI